MTDTERLIIERLDRIAGALEKLDGIARRLDRVVEAVDKIQTILKVWELERERRP